MYLSICGSVQVVMSENFKSALRDLLSILVERRAVLVEGPGGCGKTVLVNSLINGVSHVCECITIFMGEQVDSKVRSVKWVTLL